MKSTKAILVAIILVAAQLVQGQTQMCVKTARGANFRSSPQVSASNKIGVIPRGSTITYTESERAGGWYWRNVTHDEQTGWVAQTPSILAGACVTEIPVTAGSQQDQADGQQGQSGEANNMCFLGWSCNTPEMWQSGYQAYIDHYASNAPDGRGGVIDTTPHGGLKFANGTIKFPPGCGETWRFDGVYVASVFAICTRPEKLHDPIPPSWLGNGCYVSSRSEYYSQWRAQWIARTYYRCGY